MSSANEPNWLNENALRLERAAGRLEQCLQARLANADETPSMLRVPAESPLALERISQRFGLAAGEQSLLLLCHLLDRHTQLADLAARVQRDTSLRYANFGLASELVPGLPRVVLSPSGALRRWRLIELAPNQPWSAARLSSDERIQFYLEGHNALDVRLDGLIRPVRGPLRADASFDARVSDALRAVPLQQLPAVELTGARVGECLSLVAAASAKLGLTSYVVHAADIPEQLSEREGLARLWEREAMLLDAALLIDARTPPRDGRLQGFLESLEAVVFVATSAPLPRMQRTVVRVMLEPRSPRSEIARWRAKLGPLGERLNGSVKRAASQFQLDDAALEIVAKTAQQAPNVEEAADVLWDTARQHSRRTFDSLAECIDSRAGWEDLVLPAAQLEVLRTIPAHVRARYRVHEEWGFAHRCARGLGLAALFFGGSGTGKTLAAEVLAGALRLDLYRVDLARLVSKYIGETEKNLATVFDAAEASGAILLFDEADALFGRRSEVRDSHDRYANIEVSYLLQRIETYSGLAILTTNQKQAMDSAFMRRIRFVVQFPFPDGATRQAIWERVFPARVPRARLDVSKLARLNLSGGHIRNIALNAAFLAADRDEPLDMSHLRSAAEAEYLKLERPLPRAELGDWT